MKHLQKTTADVSYSRNPDEKFELLSKAFELFSFETSRLETAYTSLKEQFKELNLELQVTNNKLHQKVAELDAITDYLKTLLNNITQGIVFVDTQGTITTYNNAAETILGINHFSALFNNFWQNFNDEIFGFSMREALASKQSPGTLFIEYNSPNGHHSEVEITTTMVFKSPTTNDHHESPPPPETLGILVMIRDVTDIRRLQLLANRSDRMKELGEMAAQVAHEIRNPLGGIKGFAALLKRDLGGTPELQQMASYIVEGTDNLNRLVSQVLDYARPLQPHVEIVDLLALLKEVQQHVLADENFNKPNIEISIETLLENAWIPLDQQLFKSALLNLIVNAIQAMPEGGRLTLSLKQKRNDLVLTVADTGIGIRPDNLGKLFSPFFTTKPKGNGFGLPRVHKVIQAHEGTIDVTSTLGKGTTFTIKLPLKNVTPHPTLSGARE